MARAPKKYPGVRQVGDKWYADGYDPESKKKTRIANPETGGKSFDTHEQAVQAKLAWENTKRQPRRKVWTVRAWSEYWTSPESGLLRPKQSTNLHNAERIALFVEQHGDLPLEAVDRRMAREFSLAHPGRFAAVRAMFSDALADGLIENNPFAGLKGVRQNKGRKNIVPLTEKEIGLLMACADDMYPDWPVMSACIAFSAFTGARAGEMFALRWADLDWQAGTVRIDKQFNTRLGEETPTKSGMERTVVIYPQALERLRLVPKVGEDRHVFYTRRDSKAFTQTSHGYYWRQVRARFMAKLPDERAKKLGADIDWHELRHFHGSWLADKGASAQDIAFQLGHQDGGRLAQQLYIHTYEENALERLRRVGLTEPEPVADVG